MYALTAAYISGAGELLASSLNQWLNWNLPPSAGVLLFTGIGGAVVCIGTSLVDLFNRFLFSAKNYLPRGDAGAAAAAYSPDKSPDSAATAGAPALSAIPVIFHLVWFSR